MIVSLLISFVPNMSSPRHTSSPQIIDLTFLSETEEASLRAVLEEDLKLQQAEESRLKYFISFACLVIIIIILQIVTGYH